MTRPHQNLEKVRHFTNHKDACSHAKANPGFVVICDENGWIAGKLMSKSDFEKKDWWKEYRKEEVQFEYDLMAEIKEVECQDRIERIEYEESGYCNLRDYDDGDGNE